ncbi:MAG: hypothetical protein ABIH09_01735 [Candidatus Omnitrophota bacterium]
MNERLYEEGKNEFSKLYVLVENVLFIIQFILAYLGMKVFKISNIPLLSLIYIIFAMVMLVFILRKHLCAGCYYYGKWCHCGWGKLSSLMYKKDTGNIELGGKLAGMTWGVLMGVPLLVMILAIIIRKVTFFEIAPILIPFIIVVMINGAMHAADCKKCKMRFVCPGSAAKK